MRHKLLVPGLLLLAFGCSLRADKNPVTIDALFAPKGARASDSDFTWAPNGAEFVRNRNGVLQLYDVSNGRVHDILAFDKLLAEATPPQNPAAFDWTNRRVDEQSIQWFPDSRRLLVSANGDLFIVNVKDGRFDQLTKTEAIERDPKLSPDGRFVAFGRGPNLYTLDLASRHVTPLTTNGTGTLLNGELDWVYPEELDLGTAYWWSPDSRSIAYLQFDVAREPVFPQVSLTDHHGVVEPERFPQPGDPNADVTVHVVDADGAGDRLMNFGEPRGNLIARLAWLPSSRELAVERLPRIQNKLDLLVADSKTGVSRVFLHEEDPCWINVKGDIQFLPNGRLLWTSERDGFRHLYLYGADGRLQKQLTSGAWEVDAVVALDAEHNRVFYTSTEASPLERQLYVVGLDAQGKQRLTQAEGTHSIVFSPTAAFYLDRFSSLKSPPQSILARSDGSQLRVYRAADLSDVNAYDIRPVEMVTVKAADGTPLYARLIKPPGFDASKKYPAIVMVYGGPDVQVVTDTWAGLSWDQALAQKGYVIWQLDNHGSTGRGHQFESVIFHHLGARELADQKTGIEYLLAQGFVDPHRIGLFGWSYGGYMTLYTATHSPGLIRAAVSGAPVTNWRNYDSIYTERYMGLPADNAAGYEASSPTSAAANLNSKLLLLHNIEDDNVHFMNSVQMAKALEEANKQFFMVVYPQKSHGVTGPLRRQMLEEATNFFDGNLR